MKKYCRVVYSKEESEAFKQKLLHLVTSSADEAIRLVKLPLEEDNRKRYLCAFGYSKFIDLLDKKLSKPLPDLE